MDIIWTDKAYEAWCEAADYIFQEFGFRAAEEFLTNTEEWQETLSQTPLIGKKEPLLSQRKNEYRSIVISKQNKLIYYIDVDKIYISDFWDTRREPLSQANTIS